MKRLIIVLLGFTLSSNLIIAQLSGNGTTGSPYTGTLDENIVWHPDTYSGGIIYAMAITIPSGITLTVSPGEFNGGLVQFGNYTLTIDAGGTFVINPQTSVTVRTIINNGAMRLESFANEPGVASLIHRFYSGTGVVETELYLSGGPTQENDYRWHYISVPVDNVPVSTFPTLNLAQYIESLVTGSDNYPGWVASDGWSYNSGAITGPTFSTLALGAGYNYYSETSETITLTGSLNIEDVTASVTCGSGFPDYQGYNLLGNPFASCLDWDYIVKNFYPSFVNNAIYYTSNGLIASYVDGIASDGGSGTIPPLQGFFVKATADNNTVILPFEARTHNLDQQRYKKKSTGESYSSSDTISFVRLQLKHAPDSADLVVRFNNKATAEADKMFDAYEFSKTAGTVNIWSTTGSVAYSINGLPFPESIVSIPVGMNIKKAGTYKLSSNELKNLDHYSVILKDLKTSKIADLKKGEFIEFEAIEGMTEDRFMIVITKSATAIPEYSSTEKEFRIYFSSGLINIMPLSDDYSNVGGSVTIYDLAGSKVFQQNNIDWQGSGAVKQFTPQPSWKGIYMVEVKAGSQKFVRKINIL